MPTRTPKELRNDIQRAAQILDLFTDPSQGRDLSALIPSTVLANAHGIVFIRVYRVGFGFSAKNGTGIIIARLPDGNWSAPSGVSMLSLGIGHMFGAEAIDMILVMNYRGALKAFLDGGGQMQLGAGVSISAGPFGRSADVAASASMNGNHVAATYAYSSSKGLYLGYQLEGSKISERVNTNQAYYGRPISANEILTGAVSPPQDAAPIYNKLLALGAGPRPGAAFGPRKSIRPVPPRPTSSSFAHMPPQQPQRPQQKQAEFDPPPPYEPRKQDEHVPMTSKPSQQSNFSRSMMSLEYNPSQAGPSIPPSNPITQPPMDDKKQPKMPEDNMSVVVAKFDFHSQEPSDLSFSKGDHIIVLKRLPDRESWWEGEIGSRRGFFPANYTHDLDG
ncbi:SH3 domain-containing YSC84-like protein 1 [Choanephora cucurbitarum]|uniref:SH3 domain-containing YSC84-like protein 1 n=1 Tax=Choanephora cucurbitarum TaxID=101091 RepID=A0A1C7NFS1_9FUNG|nr:SH3 domain-containing YSC84-like protein 1 [Choanephora cucurbitarum]